MAARTKLSREELQARIEAVRAAKRAKERRDMGTVLTLAELDAALPPVECARSRAWRYRMNPEPIEV